MFKERFDRLMAMFRQGEEGKKIDVKMLFNECLFLFEELKNEMKDASPEERQDMMRMIGEMYKEILAETQKVCKDSGMNEDQLMAYSENPSNFTPEQWEAIQDSPVKDPQSGPEPHQNVGKDRDSTSKRGPSPYRPAYRPQ